ncbi:GAF domain-containing sensor histidine kinase [Pseudothauera rhizosphaerae]|nr:GAF domain-containing sensor histidine kinase [Pseudothauera rhizosphaerae]
MIAISRDARRKPRKEPPSPLRGDGLSAESQEVDALLRQCCSALHDALPLDLVFAARRNANGSLRVLAHAGKNSAALKELLEHGLVWQGPGASACLATALASAEPYVCRDNGRALPSCWLGAMPGLCGRGTCMLPIVAGGSAWGVIVMCPSAPDTFDERALDALRTEFGAQLGAALERQTQAALVNLLGAALSAAANAIFITDRDAVIEWVNDAFVALTGYPREEAIGRTPRLLHSGVQDAEYYRALTTAIRAGRPWSGEITNRRRDGKLYVAQQTITPILEGKRHVRHFVAIQQDVTERKRLEREIGELALGAELARQSERSQIAREVHDELGGSLVSLRHDIEWLTDRTTDAASLERLQIMLELVAHSLASARQIVTGLRPAIVEEQGLGGAIGWLAREFRQHHDIAVELDLSPALKRVDLTQAVETYRVVQECLTNVAKHACASRVRIDGRINDQLLVLEVEDDGHGSRSGGDAGGRRGMTERALLMGGYLEIGRAAAGGTRVRLVVPLATGETER